MKRLVSMLVLLVGIAYPYLKAYEVVPVKAQWSGTVWGGGDYGVSQTVTCNYDSVAYCELFVGDTGVTGAAYKVDVYELNGPWVAFNDGEVANKDYAWLRFDLTTVSGKKFTRGKMYEFRFTRPGDSINYYYDANNPYLYGKIKVGGGWGQPEPVEDCDLART